MKREQALPYVSFIVDNALSARDCREGDVSSKDTLVGWQCGFEPLFIAVRNYLGGIIDAEEATELAIDYLLERRWFSGEPKPPDYVIEGAE